MRTFILRDLDPAFWDRVKAKAAADYPDTGSNAIKRTILRLLEEWLVAEPASGNK